MTQPASRQAVPGTVIALDIVAGLWACAAPFVGNALSEDAVLDPGAHVTVSGDNRAAAIAVILCLLAATVAFGLGVVAAQLAKRSTGKQ